MAILKVVMLGDVVGEPGLKILENRLPDFINEHKPDFIMVNGENSANGFGLSEETAKRIFASGADIISGGNHIWEKREVWPFLDSEKRVIRPANYPEGPGRGWINVKKEIMGKPVNFLAINLQGRELLYSIDCPFKCFDSIFETQNTARHASFPDSGYAPVITVVDFHAESSREKEALAFYIDGRANVIAGTHTHVQTADEKILPQGTAYITDLGMTGEKNAVIGMDPQICIDRVRNQVLYRMEIAANGNKASVQGIIAEIDDESGKAVSIKRLDLT